MENLAHFPDREEMRRHIHRVVAHLQEIQTKQGATENDVRGLLETVADYVDASNSMLESLFFLVDELNAENAKLRGTNSGRLKRA